MLRGFMDGGIWPEAGSRAVSSRAGGDVFDDGRAYGNLGYVAIGGADGTVLAKGEATDGG